MMEEHDLLQATAICTDPILWLRWDRLRHEERQRLAELSALTTELFRRKHPRLLAHALSARAGSEFPEERKSSE